jgi:predicted DCC family thiol-disulfide oxidoreductase YuxK
VITTGATAGKDVVFYDGVCTMCNGFVRFLLERDPGGRFRFAPLQGDAARRALQRHGWNADDLDTMHLLADFERPGERLYSRSDAVLETLHRIGGLWALASWLKIFPATLRDFVYGVVVRNRYRTFGKYDSCPLAPPEWRERFIQDDRTISGGDER